MWEGSLDWRTLRQVTSHPRSQDWERNKDRDQGVGCFVRHYSIEWDGDRRNGRLVDQLTEDGKDATYSEHLGADHTFYTGEDERLEDGNLHPEYYRALEIATRFLNDRLNHRSVNNR